ncbi:MAG: alkaline phosphatase [Pseudohongiella sp.]|nr:alkaline phosphatase [Pseudohongiella sp.]MDP2128663.1 alkaline phosphatase [Pseudohongiella sp.]
MKSAASPLKSPVHRLSKTTYGFALALVASVVSVNVHSQTFYPAPASETPESWFASGQAELQRALQRTQNTRRAKNIILFVGDGMGISTVTAARIFAGQLQGSAGEENFLSFEQFPAVALSKTYNTNQQTSDSAGTATAIMAGIKTRAGVIGVNQHADRANCQSSLGTEVPSLMQQAAERGLATGFVTTTRVTHATPAATYAHSPERDWENDSALPEEALQHGCKDIAQQLIEFSYGNGINVALGGGIEQFLPESKTDPVTGGSGLRKDERDLTLEWTDRYNNSAFIWNKEQLGAVNVDNTQHLLGLFSRSQMDYAYDRNTDSTEPDLPSMTETAIRLLQAQSGDSGFFLMVEAGRIDHAHHAGNAFRALDDTRELSDAVLAAIELTNEQDTLIIVTADHSHSLTIGGYSTRGNPILGAVVGNNNHGHANEQRSVARDSLPYTTLGYRDGPGFAVNAGGDVRYTIPGAPGRHDLSDVDPTHPDFHQEALVPLQSEGHAGEDVAIYARGPWSHLFHSTHEQHFIYHVMRHAYGW